MSSLDKHHSSVHAYQAEHDEPLESDYDSDADEGPVL
jgi:hypothetical protein